jgi:hypothetical protein
MSIAVDSRTLTPTRRMQEALKRARDQLGVEDMKILTAALVEAAADTLHRDALLTARVRLAYKEMASRPAAKRQTSKLVPWDVELTPVKRIEGYVANPALPPDPYFLYEAYGKTQLPIALGRYKLSDLLLAMEMVQGRNPGTKPKNKAKRDLVIDYIVQHITGDQR